MKYVGVVIAATIFGVLLTWVTCRVAGTDLAPAVAAVGVAAIWVFDVVVTRRTS